MWLKKLATQSSNSTPKQAQKNASHRVYDWRIKTKRKTNFKQFL